MKSSRRSFRGTNFASKGPALALLGLPLLFIGVAFLYPVSQIIIQSFLDPQPGLQQYAQILGTDSSRRIITRTVFISVVVTFFTVLLGYPYAYALRMSGPKLRAALIILVLTPFWISLIVRTFAWVVLLRSGGLVASISGALGLGDEPLLGTTTGVIIAMVQVLLPFMILPLYNSLLDIDSGLLKASSSLGANKFTQFRTVFLPLSAKGIVAGASLVFVLCLGFYLTPQLVGSPREPMLGQLVGIRVQTLLDFSSAGALTTIILLLTACVLFAASRLGASGGAVGAGLRAIRTGKGG